MKLVECSYAECGNRRIHHERQDELRPHAILEMEDDYDGPYYCSMTCGIMDGWLTLTYETPKKQKARQDAWRLKRKLNSP